MYGGALGGGKSVFLCTEGIQLSLDYPGNVGFLGRWESTTFNRTTLVTLLTFLPEGLIYKHSTYEHYISLINGSLIYYGGLKPTQKSAPIDKFKSMNLGWFALDECTEIPDEDIFLILSSRLRLPLPGIHYRGLLASNPERGWVRNRFIKNSYPDHRFIPAIAKDNPHLPSDYVDKLLEIFPVEWVEKYLNGDWDFAIEDYYLFSYAMLESAMIAEIEPSGDIVLGVDFARTGKDFTVVSLTQGGYNEIIYRCNYTPDLMPVCGIIGSYIEEYNPKSVICDSVGLGAGAFDRLCELHGKDKILSFVGGSSANNPKRYINRRAEAYWGLRTKMQNGEISLPNDIVLKSQGSSIKYEIHSDSKIQIEGKEDMRRRGLDSPDDFDAIMMSNSMGVVYYRKGRIMQWRHAE